MSLHLQTCGNFLLCLQSASFPTILPAPPSYTSFSFLFIESTCAHLYSTRTAFHLILLPAPPPTSHCSPPFPSLTGKDKKSPCWLTACSFHNSCISSQRLPPGQRTRPSSQLSSSLSLWPSCFFRLPLLLAFIAFHTSLASTFPIASRAHYHSPFSAFQVPIVFCLVHVAFPKPSHLPSAPPQTGNDRLILLHAACTKPDVLDLLPGSTVSENDYQPTQ